MNNIDFYKTFKNEAFDPASLINFELVGDLLKIVEDSHEPLEGNIFYEHHGTDFTSFNPRFLDKRRSLAIFSIANQRILEIGFNAGFSSLLLLTMNKELSITALDICAHKYTEPCFNYLRSQFGDRIRLIKGNSLTVLPVSLNNDNNFTGYHIDGGHGVDIAEADLVNILSVAKNGSVICFDDTDDDYYELKIMLLKYVLSGKIIDIGNSFGFINNKLHMFFRVVK